MTVSTFEPVAFFHQWVPLDIRVVKDQPPGTKLFTESQLQQAYEAGKRDAVPKWLPIETAPMDSTHILVFCPKFGVRETVGRLAQQPQGESGWVPLAWKPSVQSVREVLDAIAAAPKGEKE